MPEILDFAQGACSQFAALEHSCVRCGTCTQRCPLLEEHGWNLGALCSLSREVLAGVHDAEVLRRAMAERPDLYHFMRTCEACNRCTVHCPRHLSMSHLWRPWRGLVRAAGCIDDTEVGLVKVDCTWHTFSAYRHVQGVAYDDVPQLYAPPLYADTEDAGTDDASVREPSVPHAETLFFPGCTLVSYAPELTRAVLAWLDEHVGPTLLATQCCGWPLECAGELQRTGAWRLHVAQAAQAQGVKRIVTVCPGCQRQLQEATAQVAPDIEYVSFAQLLVDAGMRVDASMLAGVELPVTVVDSCNDRTGQHGDAVRQLFGQVDTRAFPCTAADAWCCGAGGNVSSYDPQISRSRTRRSYRLCEQAQARTLVAACPTCAYTYAFERWTSQNEGDASLQGKGSINYLEIVFGMRIDWPSVFDALTGMWEGEHGAWVARKLLGS